MPAIHVRRALLGGVVLLSILILAPRWAGAAHPAEDGASGIVFPPGIHVDVPVRLSHAKAVFDVDEPDFSGAEPTVFVWLNEVLDRLQQWGTRRSIIAVLHGEPGSWALDDAVYDRVHGTSGGNPYKATIEALSARGVRFELCAYTMELNGWTNADLIPHVAVTTGAVLRLIELQQKGYALLQP